MLQPRLTMYDCVTTIRWSLSIEFPVEYKDFFPLEHMQNSLIIRYGSQLSLLSLHGQTCSFWRAVFLSLSGNSWWNRFFAYDKKKRFLISRVFPWIGNHFVNMHLWILVMCQTNAWLCLAFVHNYDKKMHCTCRYMLLCMS